MKSLTIRFDCNVHNKQNKTVKVTVSIRIYQEETGKEIKWEQVKGSGQGGDLIPASGTCDRDQSELTLFSSGKRFARLKGFKVPGINSESKPAMQGIIGTYPNKSLQLSEDTGRWTLIGNNWHSTQTD